MQATSFAPTVGHITREALDRIYTLGLELHAVGRYEDAASAFRMFLLHVPAEERGYLALGRCHEALGEEMIALEIYEAAIGSALTSAHAHLARGRILLDLGQNEEADMAFDDAERAAQGEYDDFIETLIAFERGAQQ
jgi:tetratricopeptide (TPR) repeat protein